MNVEVCEILMKIIQKTQRKDPDQFYNFWMKLISLYAISEKTDILKEYEEFKKNLLTIR